jgi:hypothetical protein
MYPALTNCRVCSCSQRSPNAAFAHVLFPDFQLKEKNLEVEGMLGSALVHVSCSQRSPIAVFAHVPGAHYLPRLLMCFVS